MNPNSENPPQASASDPDAKLSTKVRVNFDALTFDDLQKNRLRQMERRIEADTRRRGRHLKKEIERMRQKFLELEANDGGVVVDSTKTAAAAALDCPVDAGRRRFKVQFNMAGYSRKTIVVTTDGEKIRVAASRIVQLENGGSEERQYTRTVEKPPEVDQAKLRSYLTIDDVLIVEASSSFDLGGHVIHRSRSAGSGSRLPTTTCQSSSSSSSSSNNSGGSYGGGGTASSGKEKIGAPVFRDEDGRRRMRLIVDIGTAFQANDIHVQVIKENKILVKAKREKKSLELKSKHKFCKEFELSEKLEIRSLRGALQNDGRLVVSAFGKISKKNLLKSSSDGANNTDDDQQKSATEKVAPDKSGSDGCYDSAVAPTTDYQKTDNASD